MPDNDRNNTVPASTSSQGSRTLRPSGFIQSVDRALSILEIFTREQPECGVSDIARALSLNKSTTFGLLSTLERRGYVEQNPENGRYRLGLKALEVGSLKIASFDVAGIAHPILKNLVAQLGETAHLAIYDRGEVIYIDKVESDNTLRIASFIGKRNPAYCTGVGKCLLAFQPKNEIERVVGQGLEPRTPKTIVNPREFLDELSKIRATDHARDDEEFTLGLVCASAPVRDSSGQVIAAISVSAPTIRTPPERQEEFSRILEEAARTISQTLGYRPR